MPVVRDQPAGPLPRADSPHRREGIGWRWLLAIFLAALAYRGLCFSLLHEHPLLAHPIVDAGFHDAWARRIVCGDLLGHGPDDVFKPPLYPYFLAAIYAGFGRQIHLVQWVQFLLGSVSCVLLAVLAGRLLGRTAGKVAGLISAFYAPYVFFELQLLTPAVSIFLNLAALLLLTRGVEKGRFRRDLAAGAILGLSAGVRPDVILPAALVILYLVVRGGRTSWRYRLGRVSCLAIAFAGAVLPIALRNYHITKAIIPISSNAGINFYVGNVASADGTAAVPVGLRWERLVAGVPQAVLERPASASRWWLTKARQQMQSEPWSATVRLARKSAAFFNRREFRNNICYHFLQRACRPMGMSFGQYGLILPLAVCGLALLCCRSSEAQRAAFALCGLWVGGYWLLGIVFFVTARFRLPAIPLMIIPAAWALIRIMTLLRERRWKAVSGCAAGLLIAGILAWPVWFGRPQAGWAGDYVNLGNSLRAAEDLPGARKAYEQALVIHRDDPDAHYLLARMLLTDTPAQALQHLKAARRALPDSPDVMLAMGHAYMALGDTQQARLVLEKLVRLPDTSNLWPKRAAWAGAHIMLAELEPSRAPDHWGEAWSIDPRTAAEASFLRRRDLDRALETFQAEALEKTWDWYSQANYGMILLELGRAGEAVAVFRRAVALAPERDALRFHLARALSGSGRKAQAAAVFEDLDRALPDCPLRHQVRQLLQETAVPAAPPRHE